MRILYLGTPEHSALCLKYLFSEGINVIGVVTQPDRPSGRSLAPKEPPVKRVALEHNVPVFQFEKMSNDNIIEQLTALQPDIIAVFAFGEFLSDRFIGIPRISTVNLHLSLLPKYRGAAPVQWAIINGEKTTGVTTFHIVKQMDAGDIIYQEEAPIFYDDTSTTLMDRLTDIGSRLFVKTLKDLLAGSATRKQQNHSLATRARKLTKADGHIDWRVTAEHVYNLVRGTNPWPCAYSLWMNHGKQKMVRFFSVNPVDAEAGEPGMVFAKGNELCIYSGDKAVKILSAQVEGRRVMSGMEFLNGHREMVGTVLG
jgi:methionyl-tRNA formyltransferase